MNQPTRRRRGLTEPAAVAAIDQACRQLRLPTVRGLVTDLAVVAEKEQLTYNGFLAELLLSECDDRNRRRSVRRVKAAGFPREKWLQDFDFQANPNINPATIHTLAGCAWVRNGQPLCLIGDSGTGKSHLLIALGTVAAENEFRVKYTLATKLVNELVEAADEKVLAKTIARYGRVDLLCIDEWGQVLGDNTVAAALWTGCCTDPSSLTSPETPTASATTKPAPTISDAPPTHATAATLDRSPSGQFR